MAVLPTGIPAYVLQAAFGGERHCTILWICRLQFISRRRKRWLAWIFFCARLQALLSHRSLRIPLLEATDGIFFGASLAPATTSSSPAALNALAAFRSFQDYYRSWNHRLPVLRICYSGGIAVEQTTTAWNGGRLAEYISFCITTCYSR